MPLLTDDSSIRVRYLHIAALGIAAGIDGRGPQVRLAIGGNGPDIPEFVTKEDAKTRAG